MQHQTAKTILGLDLGTSSIGWCLVDNDPSPKNIIAAGVRIFPEGMDRSRGEKSLNQDRRLARSIRRQTYRRRRRKDKLLYALIEAGLLPADEVKRTTLMNEADPYPLRAAAIESRLEPWQIGRALYHLGQRRGYLSNRKTGQEKDGKVAEDIQQIYSEIDAGGFKTLGQYLASLDPHQHRIRGRYTSRQMYIDEFNAIWDKQVQFYPEVLSVANRKLIHDAIFFQRPLKIQKHLVGYCEFETDRKRAPAASLIAQEFRLWSSINNIKVLLGDGSERWLTDKERLQLHEALKTKKTLTWERIRKLLGFFESDRFNLERVRKSGMLGNQTVAILQGALGVKPWKALGERKQEDLVHDLVFLDDKALKRRLQKYWKFEPDVVTKLFNRSLELPKGYMHLSQKAMRAIVKHLAFAETKDNRGLTYDKACEQAGYQHTKEDTTLELNRLSFAGKLAKKSTKEGKRIPPNHPKYLVQHHQSIAELRNPLVERAMYQVRKVVNAIIREYGKPGIIRLEMARDLKNNAKQRDRLEKQQRKNEEANKEARAFFEEHVHLGVVNPSRTDLLKYRLWLECEQQCPFSGKPINTNDLFGEAPKFQIEHILPYSRCLDDSYMNKTLCHVDWNHRKGNQSPGEAFQGEEYAEILQRAKKLPAAKFKRFALDAMKDKSIEEFVSQQLNESRYIATKTAEYLQQLGVKVQHVKGGTTAILRRVWGLNGILSDTGEKTRLDHRHHAVDALVIALTDRRAVKRISTESHVRDDGRVRIESYPSPISDIRKQAEAAIKSIVVSHKMQRKVKGPLHKEFLYSLTGEVDTKGIPIVAIRKSLSDMKEKDLGHIRDPKIRQLALEHLGNSKNYADAFKNKSNPFGMKTKDGRFQPIRKVRLEYNRSVTPIGKLLSKKNDKRRNVWTMGNHHIEIVVYRDKKDKLKWKGYVVSTLEAALRNVAGKPIVKTEHADGEQFVMALHANDVVRLRHKGQEKLCRVQKMDINQNIVFREHFDNNLEVKEPVKFTANSLRAAEPTLLEIDPLGKAIHEYSI